MKKKDSIERRPLVSVLVSAYNVESYISYCVEAILNQTYSNLEIIFINDGSKDNTLQILEKFRKKDNRIRIINNEKNLGIIASLNTGLKHVSGEYIARTDADDITVPHWIEVLVGRLEDDLNLIAIGAYLKVLSDSGNGSQLAKRHVHDKLWMPPLTHRDIVDSMLIGNQICNNTMVMRSSIYKKYGLKFEPNYKYSEDYKFWLEVTRLGQLATYPEPLVFYRLHGNQTTSLYRKEQYVTAKKIRREAINYYLSDRGINNLPIHFSYQYIVELQESLLKMNNVSKKALRNILYSCYLSLEEFSLNDIFSFLFKCHSNIFSYKEKSRILKRFLFPRFYKGKSFL